MEISFYLAKTYADPPCWRLVRDVYSIELGRKLPEFAATTNDARAIATAVETVLHAGALGFSRVEQPMDHAVVLMGRTRMHHLGVCWEGKVLHASSSSPVYQDLFSLRDDFPVMQFWMPPLPAAAGTT